MTKQIEACYVEASLAIGVGVLYMILLDIIHSTF